jgi:hypothetical protein
MKSKCCNAEIKGGLFISKACSVCRKEQNKDYGRCHVCGTESEEYNICPKGCFSGCCDPDFHIGGCDGSC